MEKTLQRQLLEMLQTLEEGIRYIGQEGNPAMLRECITAIRAIRETCQQSLPVKRQAVYVDLFDGMAQALQQLPDQADQATLQQTTDLCQELIEYARQALQKELTRKKIMVFLPYKASMWDSLESVWKAAYEDKAHCETYVIPIPYCDRNPDMTAKEWHCEAGLFPDYVPVLDWREYSRDKLREMHPDVIFIHNPYDNFNAVTSVDMQYYSRNLKGIADKLVYIPYFVMGDTIPPHFCQTQGVINADYVIVQDENIKEQYERYYPGGNPPEGKILALGSPKFDKVCNATKNDYVLPAEWKRLIGDKKVILYNTSLTAMLEHVDKFNDKLRNVFDIFKQRDDVVLWWRPHPLLRATIDSMTPELRDEYRQIEQEYIDEGWGIYDDTPEMDRAIVCTDAYYGDGSSLVWLYRATGKKVLIEDFLCAVDYKSQLPLISMDTVKDDNGLWFISLYTGAVMHIDFKSLVVDRLYFIPEERRELSCALVEADGYLYFAPYNMLEFWRMNITDGKFEKIDMGLSAGEKERRAKCQNVLKYNDCIYFFGQSLQAIYIYNYKTGLCKKENGFLRNLFSFISAESISQKGLFYSYRALEDNRVYLPVACSNCVLEYNMLDGTYQVHQISNDIDERYFALGIYKNDIILTNECSEEVVWNKKRLSIKREKHLCLVDADHVWAGSCKYFYVKNDIVIYIPATHAFLAYRKVGSDEIKYIELKCGMLAKYPDIAGGKFGFAIWIEDELWFQSDIDGMIYIFNSRTFVLRKIQVYLDKNQLERVQKNMWTSNDIMQEGIIELLGYCTDVYQMVLTGNEKVRHSMAGKYIYKKLCR